ncbi:PCKG carboxykinase, partial [Spizaetus tyrannus]|nr:PCKG carboxykinase [Spizaetus tyrannus]
GRTMYILPFSMGPVGSPLAKVGLQLTDSPYVAASMRIMTRVGPQTFPALARDDFVRCLHSVGRPLPPLGSPDHDGQDPRVLLAVVAPMSHIHGGPRPSGSPDRGGPNVPPSWCPPKPLDLLPVLGRPLDAPVTSPLPFSGRLRAINPESGFFGVAPGTSMRTNPNAMLTIQSNTIFTNVGQTSDGGVYWEGIDQPLNPGTALTSWLGQPWTPGK